MNIIETPYQKVLMLEAEIDEHNNYIKKLKEQKELLKEQYMNSDIPFNIDKECGKIDKMISKHLKDIKKKQDERSKLKWNYSL